MIRRLAPAGLLLAALLVPLPASAQDTGTARALRELDRARDLLGRALDLYREGRADRAYTAARNAYLDHFELVEIPLRVRDEALTLALEERFAELRNLIRSGAPEGEVRSAVAALRDGLDDVERTLASPGLGAPLVAFGFSFATLFREGLEAVLVVAAVLGFLETTRATAYRGPVLRGVGLALAASAATFVLATLFVRLAPLQRELLEAGTTLLAVGVLFYVSFWLVARLEQRRWLEFLRARVWAAAATGSTLALAGVGFTAVYREGFETTLFYQALLLFARGLEVWVGLGAAAAAVVLGAVGWAVFRAGRRVPARAFLGTAVGLVMALSVAFLGNAVRGLQEAALLPVTVLRGLPRLPIFLAELTGWHPTVQTVAAQAGLAALYLAGAGWLLVVRPKRGGGSAPAPQARVELAQPAGEG